jgi:hypothetical protein
MYVIYQNVNNKSKANKAKAKIELLEAQAPQVSLAYPFISHSSAQVAQVGESFEALIHVIGAEYPLTASYVTLVSAYNNLLPPAAFVDKYDVT